jgi:hypothetical protein
MKMYLLKIKKDHSKKTLIFVDILKATEEKSRIRIRIRNTYHTDSAIRIKTLRIRNTGRWISHLILSSCFWTESTPFSDLVSLIIKIPVSTACKIPLLVLMKKPGSGSRLKLTWIRNSNTPLKEPITSFNNYR